tara:strand:- start:108 stop:221 length:114 start_codon:yes stop_codon:yes gene_type:complete
MSKVQKAKEIASNILIEFNAFNKEIFLQKVPINRYTL